MLQHLISPMIDNQFVNIPHRIHQCTKSLYVSLMYELTKISKFDIRTGYCPKYKPEQLQIDPTCSLCHLTGTTPLLTINPIMPSI